MSEHHPLCPFKVDGAWRHDCQCDLIVMVYARAWDEVSEEVMAKVRECEHLIAEAVREERERIAQALMGLETYHRFVDTDGHVSVRIHDQQQVREDAARIARGGAVHE